MPAFLSQSDLGKGDLRLVLTNDLGYRTDPYVVKWTIYTASGQRVSGNRLPAIRSGVGDYYAPWHACASNGCHEIAWEYQESPEHSVQIFKQGFFIISSCSYECCDLNLSCPGSSPDPSCATFFIGNLLGRGDLSLFLKDDSGAPVSAYSVTWQIIDHCGCAITPPRDGVQISLGEYYASWYVNVIGGDFQIRWTVMEDIDSPKESFSSPFTVISPSVSVCTSNEIFPLSVYNAEPACNVPHGIVMMSCKKPPSQPNVYYSQCYDSSPAIVCPSMPSNGCDFLIPRSVHLALQTLPYGGSYTSQPAYNIPSRVRLVTFYIKYRRNQVNGRVSLRLFWGNGTEEAQSTLIDESFINSLDSSQQSMYLNTYDGPVPPDDNFIIFSIESVVPGGSKTVRLLASESGTVSNPGIVEITLTAST